MPSVFTFIPICGASFPTFIQSPALPISPSRNPRFVGQVFRRVRLQESHRAWVVIPDLWGKFSDKETKMYKCSVCVVIPDLWGKFSDGKQTVVLAGIEVVIPDLWGKFSDDTVKAGKEPSKGRNPRFVGQVFRQYLPASVRHLL